eukprot:scaffold3202_cov407-Prasinococcus_capsulatus_cf.AAC.15
MAISRGLRAPVQKSREGQGSVTSWRQYELSTLKLVDDVSRRLAGRPLATCARVQPEATPSALNRRSVTLGALALLMAYKWRMPADKTVPRYTIA